MNDPPPQDPDDGETPPPSPYGAPPPPYGAAQPPGAYPPGFPVPPGGFPGVPASNQKALWSMVTGIVSVVPIWMLCCGPVGLVLGGTAIGLGMVAKKEIEQSGHRQTGDGQAQAGVVLGIIGCVLGVLAIIAGFAIQLGLESLD